HLALVAAGGTGAYTVYLDNFQVVTTATLPGTVTMKQNSTLTFTASGTDPDPGSGLNFGVDADSGAAGATIDAVTGAFTWTPTAAGTTNNISVFVNDNPINGAIAKTDSKVVTVVTTADTLAVQAAGVSAGETATLSWAATVGGTYQVQAKHGAEGDWGNV